MAVGKRLRFQIFRRDNFACRYCGATAQAGAVLEVDHVKPQSDGGKDVATNLVAACEDCNSGKSNIPLSAPPLEDVPQADFMAAVMARQQEVEDPPTDPLTERATDLEVGANLRWHVAYQGSTRREAEEFGVNLITAIAMGYSEADIFASVAAVGEARSADLLAYLPDRPEGDSESDPTQQATYDWAVGYLAGFIPEEQRLLIWKARLAAGDYWPTRRELIRAAAGMGRWEIEEVGRDGDMLREWLRRLPGGRGTECLQEATRQWDDANKGYPGHAAVECPDEVLEVAVGLALNAEVPHA